jgi:hypothetical protein
MKVHFKITLELLDRIRVDLRRNHAYAYERVGFLFVRVGQVGSDGVIILAHSYVPVQDDHYEKSDEVGALIGPLAFQAALQHAYFHEVGAFHVHMHDHMGTPWFSRVDLRESKKFVPDFFNVRPHLIHGAVVLSGDSLAGLCWHPQRHDEASRISDFTVVGQPLRRRRF